MLPQWAQPKDRVASSPEGLQCGLAMAISLKPGGGTTAGSFGVGSGMGDSPDKVKLESPCPVILCSSACWHWALLPLELQLWQCHLKLPRLRGTHLTGVTGHRGYIIFIQLGNSLVRTASFFSSASCGIGGTSGSPAGEVAGSSKAAGGWQNHHHAYSPGPLFQGSLPGYCSSQTAPSIKVVKGLIAHLSSWMHLAKRHGWSSFGGLAFFSPILQGLYIC